MTIVFAAAFAVLGLIVGSFLNVVIFRLASGEAVVFGRSHCVKCGVTLRVRDLIPVFSFLFLRGKCHSCGIKISWQYPLVEVATAGMFAGIAVWFARHGYEAPPRGWEGDVTSLLILSSYTIIVLYLLFHACVLLILFVYDLRHQSLPNKLLWPGIGVALVPVGLLVESEQAMSALLAAAIAGGFFLLLYLVSKGKWIGFGDVKLGVYLGLLVGFPRILVALFVAYVLGAIIGVGLIITKKAEWGSKLPFGPFLILGTAFAWVWGEMIISRYLSLLA